MRTTLSAILLTLAFLTNSAYAGFQAPKANIPGYGYVDKSQYKKLLKKIDKEIKKEEKRENTLEESITRIEKKMDKNIQRRTRYAKRKLDRMSEEKLNKKLKKMAKKLEKKGHYETADRIEKALTSATPLKEQFNSRVVASQMHAQKAEVVRAVKKSGSYLKYLQKLRLHVSSLVDGNKNWIVAGLGLSLAIIAALLFSLVTLPIVGGIFVALLGLSGLVMAFFGVIGEL